MAEKKRSSSLSSESQSKALRTKVSPSPYEVSMSQQNNIVWLRLQEKPPGTSFSIKNISPDLNINSLKPFIKDKLHSKFDSVSIDDLLIFLPDVDTSDSSKAFIKLPAVY